MIRLLVLAVALAAPAAEAPRDRPQEVRDQPAPVAAPADTTGARAAARDPALEARATRLASELRCPVCQGLSIQDSPSPLALQMKDLIRAQLAAGRSDAEVREYFVSRYGEWVLLEPRAAGFNLLVYLLPALGLLGGAVVVAFAVRRWSSPAAGFDA